MTRRLFALILTCAGISALLWVNARKSTRRLKPQSWGP